MILCRGAEPGESDGAGGSGVCSLQALSTRVWRPGRRESPHPDQCSALGNVPVFAQLSWERLKLPLNTGVFVTVTALFAPLLFGYISFHLQKILLLAECFSLRTWGAQGLAAWLLQSVGRRVGAPAWFCLGSFTGEEDTREHCVTQGVFSLLPGRRARLSFVVPVVI